jgi:pilus assembly protein CpaF
LDADDLVANQSIPAEMLEFLAAAVQARLSFLISGGAGAGKTTLLNALSAYIPDDERLVTIEDSAELILQHPHVVRLETRDANVEGAGEVTQRDLVRNSLRMRPDRILIGEVRGAEALDMLQAMNTGHEGSLTTIHANDARDALARLEMMVAMTGLELPVGVVRQYVAAGIRLVVHLARLKGGARRVMRISEIVGVGNGDYQIEEVFGFRQEGVDSSHRAVGEFYATGYHPSCVNRLKAAGVPLPEAVFEARTFPDRTC